MTRMQKKNLEPNQVIIIIHIFMVGFHGNRIYQMKERAYRISSNAFRPQIVFAFL